MTHAPRPSRRRTPGSGFSLVELLVVIGLIALLLSIVLVALRAVRGQSDRSATGATLRQLSQAFNTYSSDNDGALLPGYISEPASWDRVGARVRGPNGNDIAGTEDASSYVWRLAEYLDSWQVVLTGYSSPLQERFVEEVVDGVIGGVGADVDELGVARAPAIGMNTTWVGGDDRHFIPADPGSSEPGNRDPWSNPYETQAVTSSSQVRNTTRLIVFAPTARWNAADWAPGQANAASRSELMGAPALMPPRFPGQDDFTWVGSAGQATIVDPNEAGGWDGDAGSPAIRGFAGEERVPVGRFDGSFSTVTTPELQGDPRSWDPRANPLIFGNED